MYDSAEKRCVLVIWAIWRLWRLSGFFEVSSLTHSLHGGHRGVGDVQKGSCSALVVLVHGPVATGFVSCDRDRLVQTKISESSDFVVSSHGSVVSGMKLSVAASGGVSGSIN